MIAATQNQTQSLDLIKLVLSIASNGVQSVPRNLLTQFETIVDQAHRIVINPTSLSGEIDPESIELALDLKSIEGLSDSFDSFKYKLENITPDLAKKVLSELEQRVV